MYTTSKISSIFSKTLITKGINFTFKTITVSLQDPLNLFELIERGYDTKDLASAN
jgi:hypothetical protein